ncbi:hypothetical protein EYF80_044643 [Liparis tanakae]|uniref:Uncharacterized protein n=1 Tax=Liparis tanakae TaxID=230148 RepID=A0A4Z2FV56_9TELE|nr:hypothetical protein EYF80_044643 [Liparis tanakae]
MQCFSSSRELFFLFTLRESRPPHLTCGGTDDGLPIASSLTLLCSARRCKFFWFYLHSHYRPVVCLGPGMSRHP